MEELSKLVKADLWRTLLWALIAVGIAGAVYYLVW
jgi:nitrate reductase NapE component